METRACNTFGPEYELVQNSQDIEATMDRVGLDYDPYKHGLLFVREDDAEILEVWATNHTVAWNWATFVKIYDEGRFADVELKEHYIVLVGMPGYMPDALYPAETKKQAIDIAKDEKSAFLDMGDLRVAGNIRKDLQYDVIRKGIYGDSVWVQITITTELYTDYEWQLLLDSDI
jgi:hypothetical protein